MLASDVQSLKHFTLGIGGNYIFLATGGTSVNFDLKLSLYRVLREGGLVGPQGPKGDQGAAGSDGTGVVRITRAAYDALAVKDANTLYAVIG